MIEVEQKKSKTIDQGQDAAISQLEKILKKNLLFHRNRQSKKKTTTSESHAVIKIYKYWIQLIIKGQQSQLSSKATIKSGKTSK